MRRYRARRDGYGVKKYNEARWEYMKLLEKQEIYWKQRAKKFWLGEATSGELTNREVVNGVIEEQNCELQKPITHEEVKKALFEIYPEKSPGPDGLNPGFYQSYWEIVGSDMVEFCQKYFTTEDLPVVLANRLKICLLSLVSDKQSTFVQGRLLTDNALIAFELNHCIRRKTQGGNGVVGFKIDISKAYDRLEWRKGDPISPYLYILCAEGLSSMIRRNEEAGLLHGCKIARGAPAISHLLFADDGYFFFKAIAQEANSMKSILQRYENLSGQTINYRKSAVAFSPNTAIDCKRKVCEIWQVQELRNPGTGEQKTAELEYEVDIKRWDLRRFNVSMLAKQEWRLLNGDNPLVTALVKAKYFPKTDFLNARLGKNPSYMWRSIYEAQTILKRDSRHMVGNEEDTEGMRVVNLMDVGHTRWDEEILKDIFNDRDIQLIRQVPISAQIQQDSWFWNLDQSGLFTVKSCYRGLTGEQHYPQEKFWKMLWSLDIPGGGYCSCTLWVFVCKGSLGESGYAGDSTNTMNRWVWDRIMGSAFGVYSAAVNLLHDWKRVSIQKHQGQVVLYQGPIRWSPPQHGWVKINIDVAIFAGNGDIGEAMGLKEALTWVKDLGFRRCVFETDSKLLADACKGEQGRSYFHTIVWDCIQLFKHFDEVLVQFVHRSANAVAHVLARATHFMSGFQEWNNVAPEFISDVLINDLF
ncbi:hypothetical protein AgCh_035325 [Apium graveolens]